MRHIRGAALLLALSGLTTMAGAQLAGPRLPQPKTIRSFLGGGGILAQPVGEFADNVGIGGGGAFTFMQSVDRNGILSLRADVAYLIYGHEHRRIPFPTAPRVELDLNTTNNIVNVSVGPQLMASAGPVRPYVAGQVGLTYMFTESSLDGTDNTQPFASTENYRFAHIAYIGSGGLLIPFHTKSTPVALDLGFHYLYNGKARYLTPGDIHEDAAGNVTYTAHHSDANLVMYRLGVRVGVN